MVEGILATVTEGTLEGKKYISKVTAQTYFGFKGIPYAKPPIGPLRFRPPEPPEPWKGVRDASIERNVCPQYISAVKKYFGDEDCLFLNVYTNQWPPTRLLPVMVFIHPGGFSTGSGDSSMYGPDFIMTEDIVLVTLNYRLGALGFLHLEETDATPNNGLRDQNAALRWVRDNIAAFGGDPCNVTLFGNSSGGACVHCHMFAPLSKGLFHRAIAQSGTVFWPAGNIFTRAFYLGKALGTNTSDPQKLADFLRTVPVKDLVLSEEKTFTEEEEAHGTSLPFHPSIETPGENAFLSGHPKKLLKEGKFYDIPFIMGITTAEGKIALQNVYNSPCLKKVNGNPECLLSWNWRHVLGKDKFEVAVEKLKNIYFGTKAVSVTTIKNYVEVQSDVLFRYPLYKSLEYHRKHSQQSLYIYQFSKKEPDDYFFPGMHMKSSKLPGAMHGADILYLFHSSIIPVQMVKGSFEEMTMKNIVKLWTNFAKTGNPSEGLDVKWPPISAEGSLPYLDISYDLKVEEDFDMKKIKILEKLLV